METQDIVRRNNKWKVGDRKSIQIWKDNWLPDKADPRVRSIPFPYLENAIVSSIMNTQGTEWDADIIHDIFMERDVKLILSIPLPILKWDDKLIWANEERGKFTVKSSYRALTQELHSGDILEWTKVWKMRLPPKIKTFF